MATNLINKEFMHKKQGSTARFRKSDNNKISDQAILQKSVVGLRTGNEVDNSKTPPELTVSHTFTSNSQTPSYVCYKNYRFHLNSKFGHNKDTFMAPPSVVNLDQLMLRDSHSLDRLLESQPQKNIIVSTSQIKEAQTCTVLPIIEFNKKNDVPFLSQSAMLDRK